MDEITFPVDMNRVEVQRYPPDSQTIQLYTMGGNRHMNIPVDQAISVAERIISAAKAGP